MQHSTVLGRLEEATRDLHAGADAPWLQLLVPNVSRSDYVQRLVLQLGFEASLEFALRDVANLNLFVDLDQSARAVSIVRDLLVLGLPRTDVSFLPQSSIPPIAGVIEAMGWLYANEWATHLHERVHQHLVTMLPDVHDACSYLSSSKRAVDARWDALGSALERMNLTEGDTHTLLIPTTRLAFGTLSDWAQRAA